jgi:hypothetical protein
MVETTKLIKHVSIKILKYKKCKIIHQNKIEKENAMNIKEAFEEQGRKPILQMSKTFTRVVQR